MTGSGMDRANQQPAVPNNVCNKSSNSGTTNSRLPPLDGAPEGSQLANDADQQPRLAAKPPAAPAATPTGTDGAKLSLDSANMPRATASAPLPAAQHQATATAEAASSGPAAAVSCSTLSASAPVWQPEHRVSIAAAAAGACNKQGLAQGSSWQAARQQGTHLQPPHQHWQQQEQQRPYAAPGACGPAAVDAADTAAGRRGALPGLGRGGRRGALTAAERGRGHRGYPGRGNGINKPMPGHVLAQQELSALQRRYGRALRVVLPLQQQQQQPQSHQLEQQPQPHLRKQQQQCEAQPEAAGAGPVAGFVAGLPQAPATAWKVSFSLMLRPTDPLWGAARGPLHVTGTVSLAQYPAAGSVTLSLQPSLGVTAAEIWVIQSAMQQELQHRHAGNALQLLSLLKWLENYAGSVLEQFHQAQQQLFGAGQQETQQQQQLLDGDGGQGHQQQLHGQQQLRTGLHLHSQQASQQRQEQPRLRRHGQQPVVDRRRQPVQRMQAPHHVVQSGGIRIIRSAQPGAGNKGKGIGSSGDGSSSDDALDSAAAAAVPARAVPEGAETTSSSSSEREGETTGSNSRYRLYRKQAIDNMQHNRQSGGGSALLAGVGSDAGHSGSATETDVSDTTSDEDYSTIEDSSEDSNVNDEVQLRGGDETGAAAAGSGPGGYALMLEGLKLDDVGVLEVVQAQLQLQCSRCHGRLTVLLTGVGGQLLSGALSSTSPTATAADSDVSAAAGSTGTPPASMPSAAGHNASITITTTNKRPYEWCGSCTVCRQQLSVLLRPKFVHESSNVLAGLKVVGCRPLDLLPGVYGVTCSDCDAVGALRGLQIGISASRNCSHCHRRLTVQIPAVSFIPRGPPAEGSIANKDRASRPKKQANTGGGAAGLDEGAPLPHNGACKHYRHSYRWLRFPCCGARYPCDLCHEEAVPDGHNAAWATRMVCGFCSREQPVNSSCKYCGKKLAATAVQPSGRNTRFWEGGKGCRDTKMLDRRDAHKYRNSKSKTKSAKAKRVGPKPWSGTLDSAAGPSR
eukprot:GHRR01010754.1.p1 GENE.GHRR01010754.1~~GHRR01010754.1.p1  ORF type:complete len:1021 (+),score=491.09 GHRR01010754.1:767-3829(+)